MKLIINTTEISNTWNYKNNFSSIQGAYCSFNVGPRNILMGSETSSYDLIKQAKLTIVFK